jgi:hypothetical protein
MNGTSGTIQQLLAIGQLWPLIPVVNPLLWYSDFLSNIALTWSAFYELMPSLLGSEEEADPYRNLFFNAANYPSGLAASNAWLGYATNTFQPLFASPLVQPPPWVMTCVYGTGIPTPNQLLTNTSPLILGNLGYTLAGDGVVTSGSAQQPQALAVSVTGTHSSIPLGIAQSGLLASLITDPRAAPSPTPPTVIVLKPVPMNVTDPPESDPVSGTVCLLLGG